MNSHEAAQAGQLLRYSVFASVNTTRAPQQHSTTWADLVATIKAPKVYASKAACPLLKLATFGTVATAKGSLRHDNNVSEVWGIEGDYDAELVAPAQGAARLSAAGIRALIYTSASHGVVNPPKAYGGPRWRVLVPLSGPVAPAQRADLVSLLNGALGGILAGESWTLSQTFYFGAVQGVAYEAHVVEGEPLDVVALCPSFEPIGPPVAARAAVAPLIPRRTEDADGAEVQHLADGGWLTGGQRDDGAVNVRCPRSELHGTDSGPSSTTYFPAGVGGRAEGGFECRHQSCGKPTTTEFWQATGLWALRQAQVAADFEDMTTPEAIAAARVAQETTDKARAARFAPIPAAVFAAGAPPAWIVRGVLPAAELAMVYGESGAGKSFLVLDLVAAVARGVPWRGLAVKQGPVVYVAAEGAGGFRKRLAAYAAHHGVDLATVPLSVVPDCPSLLGDDGKALALAIQTAGGAAVIVIDTLAQVSAGGNENSGEDMGKVLAHCKHLHRVTGALVVLVHHAGKDATKGARGWSGVRAAVDAEIEVSRGIACRSARITKQKDADDSAVFNFNLRSVMVGIDEDGEVTSCVVEHIEPPVQVRKPQGPLQQRVLQQFQALAFDGPVPLAALIAAAVGAEPKPEGHDRRRELVRRAIDKLHEGAFFSVVGDAVTALSTVPTDTPVPTSGHVWASGTTP